MKTKRCCKFVALLLTFVLVFSMIGPITGIAAGTGWSVGSDSRIFWVKTADADVSDEALMEQIRLFSSELAEKVTGTPLDIIYGDASEAGDSDIVLVLDSSLNIDAQGYVITVSNAAVTISASDADGLFYGCRHLIKELILDGSVESASETPDVLERAVSLDNGRKYYSVEWIKELIREMSWANMNALALHFSEEMGLGIESKLYPWLNGRDGELCTQAEIEDDDRYLTQEEVVEIVEYAKKYHVEIIPSLDSPGHMNYIVKMFNEQCAKKDFSFTYRGVTYTAEAGSEIGNYFHYNGKTSIVKGSRNTAYSRGIDISNEIAVAFTRSLIEEYATLFADLGCTKFDIGGDELLGWGSAIVSTSTASRWQQLDHWKEYAQNRAKTEGKSNWADAVAYDAFLYYMNDLNDLVRELGYTSVRMWNDDALRTSDTGWTGKVVQLDTDIDIWFWTTGNNTVWTYATAGYQVYNILSDYNYYVLTDDYYAQDSNSVRDSFTQSYADEIYNEWTPYTFDPTSSTLGTGKNAAIGNPNILGGAFGIWSDNPSLKTEEEVLVDLLPLIRANAAKSWDAEANNTVSYETYCANWDKIGSAPAGTVEAPKVSTTVDASALNAAIAAYEQADISLYTGDSFTAYAAAVSAARELLAAGALSQDDVDAALADIQSALNGLLLLGDNAVSCILGGGVKSSRVYVNKVATLTVSTDKSVTTEALYVVDENGKVIEATRYVLNTKNTNRDIHTFIFTVTAEDRGTHTYTVYAVLEDGSLSADFIQVTIEVR